MICLAAFMRVASVILSIWAINRLKLSTWAFFTYSGAAHRSLLVFHVGPSSPHLLAHNLENIRSATYEPKLMYSYWFRIWMPLELGFEPILITQKHKNSVRVLVEMDLSLKDCV